MGLNRKIRTKSKEKLFKHLNKNCQGEPYNPPNLKKLSSEIADDYFQYLKKKEELQKELDEEMRRSSQTSVTSQTSLGQTSSVDVPIKDNQAAELTTEKKPTETKEKPIIIDQKEQDKIIAELQSKKARLKKEIAEKEKIIHQKVLKHIFNNYEAINGELGGDIFLNSVAGDHDWLAIHSQFTDKGLVVKWLSQGFDYFQTQKWVAALSDFDFKTDADFCAWLRDVKQLTVEGIKRQSYPQNIGRLRNEYAIYLGKETELLDKHNKHLEEKSEKDLLLLQLERAKLAAESAKSLFAAKSAAESAKLAESAATKVRCSIIVKVALTLQENIKKEQVETKIVVEQPLNK